MDEQALSSQDQTARAAIAACARARAAAGNGDFSIKALCDEAGVDRATFQRCFGSRKGLMAALMRQPEPAAPALADPWLERRLRVFERALTALEAKADANARAHALLLARLEEQGGQHDVERPAAVTVEDAPTPEAAMPAEAEAVSETRSEALVAEDEPQMAAAPLVTPDEMTAFLEMARRSAREAQERRDAQPKRPSPFRSMAVAGLALLTTLAICAVLTLGHAARAPRMRADGTAHRQMANSALGVLMAQADSGDVRAQTALASAYLRGKGVPQDNAAALRWARIAALHGAPAAQYMLGSLVREKNRDSAAAFFWFRTAAMNGDVKAMHNLAIAYMQGDGTVQDSKTAAAWFARAAAMGYRDSAFDLGVLYERGMGVTQNLSDALHWYGVAAAAGDAQSAERIGVLREQIALNR